MLRKLWGVYWLLGLLLLQGCTALQHANLEKPQVSVSHINIIPSQALAPRLEIGLQITNPNAVALSLAGIAYSVSVEGHTLINGVAADIPTIPAYGEGLVRLQANTSLLGGIRLISELLQQQQKNALRYELNAKLDPGQLLPNYHIVETGEIKLSAGR